MTDRLSLGIALEGAGWHPAAWREPTSRPADLFTPEYWVDRVRDAETALADYATIEDSLAVQSSLPFAADDRTDEVRGRLDALLIAARVAPVTEHIGLIPTVTTTHTEPFHVSKAVATLDYVSGGRGGWQPKVSARADEAAHVGRREVPALSGDLNDPVVRAFVEGLFAEADDAVEVVRRLWDSWEDDAEIRDVATDRFLDRDKIHTIDFEGRFFSVRGPSITPRPPQGQPVVAALAHAEVPYRFAARSADVVFTTPADDVHARRILAELVDAQRAVGREGEALRSVADLVVFLDRAGETGAERLSRLDRLGRPLTSDAQIIAGSADAVADRIAALADLGFDGVRLRPGVLTDDLPQISEQLVPLLQKRGLVHDRYAGGSLRQSLGLPASVPHRFAAPAAV